MVRRMTLALWAMTALSACTRQIPNKVTADEYALYSAWTTAHFGKSAPEHLYFYSHTGVFDPLQKACQPALAKDGVSWALIKQLHALGEAEYPLDFYSPTNLKIPWSYKEVDIAPDSSKETFHLITFSRVAFNSDHAAALFGFFDACAFGDCGHGGYIEGREQNGEWSFRSVGCVTVA